MHLPVVSDELPRMSIEKIRQTAVRAWKIDRELHNDPLTPTRTRERKCDKNVTQVHFVPGGDWVILALWGGGIDICAAEDMMQPRFSISSAAKSDASVFQSGMASSNHLGPLFHTTELKWDWG